MTAIALTAARDTKLYAPDEIIPLTPYQLPCAASVVCKQGGMAAVSGGYAQPATAATGLQILGRFNKRFDNTGGSNGGTSVDAPAGRLYVEVTSGAFWWANSTAGDAIAQANLYADCFVVDDQTVALTDAGQTRSRAGKILGVDATLGVLVLMGPEFGPGGGGSNAKIQVVTGIVLTLGTKVVTGAGGAAGSPGFSLTASSQFWFTVTTGNTAVGAQYIASSITTGAPGTAQFTVTSTTIADATATTDVSTLTAFIIG